MNYKEREIDIIKLIESLDITPTMYKSAIEKYHNIAEFLSHNGIDAEFYPQGSFALGTVVRPYSEDDNAQYDLDAICKVVAKKSETSPEELFKEVANVFRSSDRYKPLLSIDEKCITINYADIGSVSFSIDVVPAVTESMDYIAMQSLKLDMPELASTIIAIPKHNGGAYSWFSNNPKGYKTWFDKINDPFMVSATNSKNSIFASARDTFSSIEEVPDALLKSPLQRVIQILKRSRDIYYSNIPEVDKPISAIISTLVARIAENYNPYTTTMELLEYVLSELNVYAMQITTSELEFANKYKDKNILVKRGSKWIMKNPAHNEDNLTDCWTDKDAKVFFNWINALCVDFNNYRFSDNETFVTNMKNVFGTGIVNRTIGSRYDGFKSTVFTSESSPRPWRE